MSAILTTRRIVLGGALALAMATGACVATGPAAPTPEQQAGALAGVFAALEAAATPAEQDQAIAALRGWARGGSAYSAALSDAETGAAIAPDAEPSGPVLATVTAWPDPRDRAAASALTFRPLSPHVARGLFRE